MVPTERLEHRLQSFTSINLLIPLVIFVRFFISLAVLKLFSTDSNYSNKTFANLTILLWHGIKFSRYTLIKLPTKLNLVA